jgi:flagellar basal body-associated protein FliL
MKKKLMIIGPVVLLVALFAVKTFVLAPPPPDEKKLATEPGLTYTMPESFVVNLADGGESPHFAKVGVALRFSKLSEGEVTPGEGDTPDHVEGAAELRDIVIATLQSKTSGELSGVEGRDDVKKKIVERVNKQTDLKILDVYYTEFAVQ